MPLGIKGYIGLIMTLKKSKVSSKSLHEQDFFKWSKEQSNFIKRKEFQRLDLDNLAEEIESLGISQRNELISHLKILLMHMLKCEFQNKTTKSWLRSIRNARLEIFFLLKQNPSLKRKVPEAINFAYEHARYMAEDETNIDIKTFPEECPWTQDEILKG